MVFSSTLILLTAGLLLGLAALCWGSRRTRPGRRAFVEVHPRYRALLRRQGFTEARHFLGLSGVIVSGHPDRSVARTLLADDGRILYAFLKREMRVSWSMRLASAAAGFGFVSRSLREARTLEALEREGVGCPEWLAAGEDEQGRAFLLVRETPGAVELRQWLAWQTEPAPRRRLAHALGRALARIHAAGFSHPDLYSKHVLVGADGAGVQFLDWQRSRRRVVVDARRRARDLASLHATLADELAGSRERLVCLRAYFAGLAGAAAGTRRGFLGQVLFYSRRALRRRHIREKRQPSLAWGAVQQWQTLDGDALCVTPALAAAWPGREPQWLASDRRTEAPTPATTRRWLTTADGAPALLVRRRGRLTLTDVWRHLRGRPPVSPEQRQAEILLRLQRHAIAAPTVLAMGRRVGSGRLESFLLTQPAAGAVSLTAWLAREPRPPETSPRLGGRRRLLREAGALLHRLHEAACYFDGRAGASALAVQTVPGQAPAPLLANAERIAALRQPSPGRARRDLAAVQRALTAAGCGRTDRLRFLAGYRQSLRGEATRASAPADWPGYRTTDFSGPQGDRLMSASPSLAAAAKPAGPAPAESLWARLRRGVRSLRQRPDWARFAGADWADHVMDAAVTDRFSAKQGRSTGRWVLRGPGGRRLAVYLKRHYRLAWWQGLLAAVWPRAGWSPAFQEWEHLEWARRVGVPVPEVVAAAEFVGPWGRLRSCLAVEELTDMLPLNEAVPLAAARLSPAAFRRWKCGLIAEMARLTRLLHDRCRFHKDLYLCHFYVARADTAVAEPEWRGRLFLIDLHRLGRHPWTWTWWRMKDLAQLLYSSEVPGVDARDRLYWWRMYRGPGPRRPADRWLERLVLLKWRRYRLHNARQKARRGADAALDSTALTAGACPA